MDKYMMDASGSGVEIDALPLLHEAIDNCPYRHDFSLEELIELIEWTLRGKYIPVATLDRIEGRKLGSITGRVIGRARTMHRIGQITDPDMLRFKNHIELVTDLEWCSCADSMRGRWLDPEELRPIPLDGCKNDRCFCRYESYTLRQLEREGKKPRSNLAR